ncbi:MAG: hypothetical protein GY749_47045 [Desulfobacteraceae bacterium]|nr:hypothetical protein [Desulfobacteraceae bacterium]
MINLIKKAVIGTIIGFCLINGTNAFCQDVIPAEIQSPVPETALNSTTVTFTWNDTGAMLYSLCIGTSDDDDCDVYDNSDEVNMSKTSITVSGLPNGGETLYVSLATMIDITEWQHNEYTYTAYTAHDDLPAEIQSPVPETALNSTTVTFTWNDTGADEYWLCIGTSANVCNPYDKSQWCTVGTSTYLCNPYKKSQQTNTSVTFSGLPDGGETLYVYLYTLTDGEWLYNEYTYTAYGDLLAEMQSPVPGTKLKSRTTRFIWSDAGADEYRLCIGTSPSFFCNLYDSQGTNTSATLYLPYGKLTLYVRLYSLVKGEWLHNNYTYTTAIYWF